MCDVTSVLHEAPRLSAYAEGRKNNMDVVKNISDIAHVKINSVYLRKITLEKTPNSAFGNAFFQAVEIISLVS